MINIEQKPNTLLISNFNEVGKVNILEINVPDDEYYEWTPKGNIKKLVYDKIDLKKKKSKSLNKYRIQEFLSKQPQEIQDSIYKLNKPSIFFVDIETEILDEFPNATNPEAQIVSVSIVNEKNQCIAMGLKDLTNEQINSIKKRLNVYFEKFNVNITFKYIKFEREYDMLYTLFKDYFYYMPIITGWNFIGFDWMYLIARAKYLNIEPEIASPTKKFFGTSEQLMHKVVLDYMDLYIKYDSSISVKENNSLDWVSENALGVKKVKYSGTLNDLYISDFETFIFYNIVDSFLVLLLHRKIGVIYTHLKIGEVTKVEYIKSGSSVYMTESVLLDELLKRNKYLIKQDYDNQKNNDGYEGAHVVDPKPGLYEWVSVFDFASLYPSIIRQFNISPDVYLGKNIEYNGDMKKVIVTKNGCYFKKDEYGALPTILTDLFAKRKKAKKIAQTIEVEIKKLEKILDQR